MAILQAKLNHATRILNCNREFAKTFKYNRDYNSPEFHYFKDSLRQSDLEKILHLQPGEQLNARLKLKNPRMSRWRFFAVKVKCDKNGVMKKGLDFVPKPEYSIEIIRETKNNGND